MRMMTLALLTGMMTLRLFAQEPLTLEKAVQTALEQNQSLTGARADRESAHWGKLNAFTNFMPKINLSSGYTRIDDETDRRANAAVDFIKSTAGMFGIPQSYLADIRPFAYRDAYETDVTFVQPIYNGGAEIVGVRAADAAQDKSEYQLRDTEQDVVARVKTSYYNVLKADELVALAHEAVARTRRYLETTRRREELGMRTRTDVLRWEVQLASDEGSEVNAENYLAAARLQLNEVMGVDMNKEYCLEKVALPDSGIAEAGAPASVFRFASYTPSPVDAGSDISFLENHPAMKMMEANLRLADANVSRSWTNFQPRVNLAFQYGWERNGTLALDGYKPWALSLTVSFPIFNGFGDYTNLQKAEADRAHADAQVESFRRGLLLQEANAGLNVRATKKRIEIARKGQEEALDVLNSVTRRYETGGASNVDLIDVQTAYTSAKTSYITAVYDYEIARVQLERARGTVTP